MHYNDLNAFLTSGNAALKKGPVALIFAEDEAEIASTVRHHAGLGFKAMVLFMPANFALDPEIAALVIRIDFDRARGDAFHDAVNAMIEAMPGEWLYYCFNTEYLFFPFCETRTVGEMLAFHTEERRDAMLTYVVDLYAGDLEENPDGISMEDALLDRAITRSRGSTRPTTTTPRKDSWISSAACAGGSRNIFPPIAAASTGWRCFARRRG